MSWAGVRSSGSFCGLDAASFVHISVPCACVCRGPDGKPVYRALLTGMNEYAEVVCQVAQQTTSLAEAAHHIHATWKRWQAAKLQVRQGPLCTVDELLKCVCDSQLQPRSLWG